MSLKQREREIRREKGEIDKARKKTLGHFEYKNSIDQLNILLNRYVISILNTLNTWQIQTCLFSYDSIKRIFKERASKKFDEILQNIKETTLRKIVDTHISKILTKQIQLLHYTLDELIDAGTVVYYKFTMTFLRFILIWISMKYLKSFSKLEISPLTFLMMFLTIFSNFKFLET